MTITMMISEMVCFRMFILERQSRRRYRPRSDFMVVQVVKFHMAGATVDIHDQEFGVFTFQFQFQFLTNLFSHKVCNYIHFTFQFEFRRA